MTKNRQSLNWKWSFLLAILGLTMSPGCAEKKWINEPRSASAQDSSAGEQERNKTLSNSCPVRFSKINICAQIKWMANANTSTEAVFHLKFDPAQFNSKPIVQENLEVYLWMPSMGHGSSPVTIKKTAQNDTFEISKIFFIMPGIWDVHFKIKNAGQELDHAVYRMSIN
jgi:hypothetical protein